MLTPNGETNYQAPPEQKRLSLPTFWKTSSLNLCIPDSAPYISTTATSS